MTRFGYHASHEQHAPAEFAAATRCVTVDDVCESVRVSASLDEHTAWLAEYVELGVDEVYCFNVGKEQRGFIEAFAEHVLPALQGRRTRGAEFAAEGVAR